MKLDTCLSCGADVVFVPSAKSGRAMILDAKPRKDVVLWWHDAGAWGVRHDDEGHGELVAQVVDVYTDHHATCPNAGEWEGRRR